MPVIINVDVMLARRKMSSGELAQKIGISAANLSILKTGKAKAIRFSTLSGACATPEFLMYMNYFIEQEYGDDYYLRADEVVDLSKKRRST